MDQFAHLALRLGGLPQKASNTGPGNAFTLLAKWLENGRYGKLQPLWQAVGNQLVWVRWQVWLPEPTHRPRGSTLAAGK